jgi:hypothetical protein
MSSHQRRPSTKADRVHSTAAFSRLRGEPFQVLPGTTHTHTCCCRRCERGPQPNRAVGRNAGSARPALPARQPTPVGGCVPAPPTPAGSLNGPLMGLTGPPPSPSPTRATRGLTMGAVRAATRTSPRGLGAGLPAGARPAPTTPSAPTRETRPAGSLCPTTPSSPGATHIGNGVRAMRAPAGGPRGEPTEGITHGDGGRGPACAHKTFGA